MLPTNSKGIVAGSSDSSILEFHENMSLLEEYSKLSKQLEMSEFFKNSKSFLDEYIGFLGKMFKECQPDLLPGKLESFLEKDPLVLKLIESKADKAEIIQNMINLLNPIIAKSAQAGAHVTNELRRAVYDNWTQ